MYMYSMLYEVKAIQYMYNVAVELATFRWESSVQWPCYVITVTSVMETTKQGHTVSFHALLPDEG